MISKEEIQKLASLARIELKEEEAEKLRSEIDAILDYVGQVKSVAGEEKKDIKLGELHNVVREDENPTESNTYKKELIAEFPQKEGDYLKVRKIL
jgi:aspartyl-tRNA(Asn)/glutamyl-tRNA(Gln) amidotransferase subunit C